METLPVIVPGVLLKISMGKRIIVAFDIIDENDKSIIGKSLNSVTTPLRIDNITSDDIINIEQELQEFLFNARVNEYIGHLFHRLKDLSPGELDSNKCPISPLRPFSYLMSHIEFPH